MTKPMTVAELIKTKQDEIVGAWIMDWGDR